MVRIHEVSLCDGLRYEATRVSTDAKLALARKLVAAGFRDIQATAFVRPRLMPQLADAEELVEALPRVEGVRWWALVPDQRGLERALDAGVGHVATMFSASLTYNERVTARTVRESLGRARSIIEVARAEGLGVRSYLSTVFGCPWEGPVDPERVLALTLALREAGAEEIVLADSIGVGNPEQVKRQVEVLDRGGVSPDRVGLHLHDARGMALVNAYAAWQAGVRSFDGAVGGIGGTPEAPAAVNAPSEQLLHLFHEMGESTGIDVAASCQAGQFVRQLLGRDEPVRPAGSSAARSA